MTESDTVDYTGTVTAPGQIALGVVGGAVVALILLAIDGGLWPFAIVAFLAIVAVAYYLSSVTVTVTRGRVTIGQGRWERQPRIVAADEVLEASAESLTWQQCLGLGMSTADRTTRLSVRPGPTLCMTLRDGEIVRVSTPDPQAALIALGRAPQV